MPGAEEMWAELRVPASAGGVDLAVAQVMAIACTLGADDARLARLALALREACDNALRYGQLQGELGIRVGQRTGAVVVEIADRSGSFELDASAEPDFGRPLERRRIGRLGLWLIRRLVDRVEVQPTDDGKVVRLTMALTGWQAEDAVG